MIEENIVDNIEKDVTRQFLQCHDNHAVPKVLKIILYYLSHKMQSNLYVMVR